MIPSDPKKHFTHRTLVKGPMSNISKGYIDIELNRKYICMLDEVTKMTVLLMSFLLASNETKWDHRKLEFTLTVFAVSASH